MSTEILTFTASIELPDDVFIRGATISACSGMEETMRDYLKDHSVKGTVTHTFTTKRAPKTAALREAAE